MQYITCIHPNEKIVMKTEVEKVIDSILKYVTPKPYCESCGCYLPVFENPGRELIRFWFIKQDGNVKAMPTA